MTETDQLKSMGFLLFISCFTAVTFSDGGGAAVVGIVEQFMGHS